MGDEALKPDDLWQQPDAVEIVHRAVAERRPVYVCGAGELARGLAKSLRQQGVFVTAFIDRTPHALGATLDGIPIRPVTSLSADDPRRPFMTVVRAPETDIAADLASAGWIRDKDYVIL
jgi:hypothetical protein